MLTIPTLLFLVFILSVYLFDKLRMGIGMIALGAGLTLLLNDWDNTLVSDSTTKLVFILSFLFYTLMVIYNISIEKEK
jgi:hypothetical protein